jgi:hypothetical protein
MRIAKLKGDSSCFDGAPPARQSADRIEALAEQLVGTSAKAARGCRSVIGAGDHVAEADPVGTVEFCELRLPDRMIVGRAGVHFNAGQQRRKLQVVQISCLLQDVLTREITLALLQHLQHCLAEAVGGHIVAVGDVGAGHILGHEVTPFVHTGIVLPGGIVRILQVAGGDATR